MLRRVLRRLGRGIIPPEASRARATAETYLMAHPPLGEVIALAERVSPSTGVHLADAVSSTEPSRA